MLVRARRPMVIRMGPRVHRRCLRGDGSQSSASQSPVNQLSDTVWLVSCLIRLTVVRRVVPHWRETSASLARSIACY